MLNYYVENIKWRATKVETLISKTIFFYPKDLHDGKK